MLQHSQREILILLELEVGVEPSRKRLHVTEIDKCDDATQTRTDGNENSSEAGSLWVERRGNKHSSKRAQLKALENNFPQWEELIDCDCSKAEWSTEREKRGKKKIFRLRDAKNKIREPD